MGKKAETKICLQTTVATCGGKPVVHKEPHVLSPHAYENQYHNLSITNN